MEPDLKAFIAVMDALQHWTKVVFALHDERIKS